jgi:diaminopimelate epimerase
MSKLEAVLGPQVPATPAPAPAASAVVASGRSQIRRFSKMHGAGNDFVIVDARGLDQALSNESLKILADRHRGVGCDQAITIEAPRSAHAVASYRIWNTDGSPAQQCGNGARCVAAWLRRDGSAASPEFVLDSPAGTHAVQAHGDLDFSLAMGRPEFAPERIPMARIGERPIYLLDLDGQTICFGAASMGNPHALIEVDDIKAAPVAQLGSALQASGVFPEGVNVGFVQVHDSHRVALRVFERGAGETLACGSGACAAVAILVRRGRVGRDVTVELPGGTLRIGWPRDDASITMRGPAAFVFEGEFNP